MSFKFPPKFPSTKLNKNLLQKDQQQQQHDLLSNQQNKIESNQSAANQLPWLWLATIIINFALIILFFILILCSTLTSLFTNWKRILFVLIDHLAIFWGVSIRKS